MGKNKTGTDRVEAPELSKSLESMVRLESGPVLVRAMCVLLDGRDVQFFLNRETGLVVVDVFETDGKSGTELYRGNVPKPWSPAKPKRERKKS